MLLGFVFLIHSFGFIKAEDFRSSTEDLGYSSEHGTRGLSRDRYYKYRLDKLGSENNGIAIRIFTKLKFTDASTRSSKLWSSALVPYLISTKCSGTQKKMILKAMKEYEVETCVRFTQRKNESTFIRFTPGKRCKAVYRNNKDPKLPVDRGCLKLSRIHHELMNILDFKVEQKKRGAKYSSKVLGYKNGRLQDRDARENNFAKVNYIFGCNKKETNASRSGKSGRTHPNSFETNRSQRKKRLIPDADISRETTLTDAPEDNSISIQDVTNKVSKPEVTTDNTVTSGFAETKVVNLVTDVVQISEGDSDSSEFTPHHITIISNVAETNISGERTLANAAEVKSTDIQVVTTQTTESDVTTGHNVTTPFPETKVTEADVTTRNIVTTPFPQNKVTVAEVITGNKVTTLFPETEVVSVVKNEEQISESDSESLEFLPHHNITIVTNITPRTSIVDPAKLWSNHVVPYELAEDKYDAVQKRLIKEAFGEFDNKTCVRFIPRKKEKTYISIRPIKRCSATVGKVKGGVNNVTLSMGCFMQGTILHELMHTLGFIHEQNRPDRDKYIIVMWDNIKSTAKLNYKKAGENQVTSFGQPYDYGSVMHYGMYDFSINDKHPTLVPLEKGVEIGQRKGFSKTDLIKINMMFKCNKKDYGKEPKPTVSPDEFGRKFLEYVSKLFKAIFRELHRFHAKAFENNMWLK